MRGDEERRGARPLVLKYFSSSGDERLHDFKVAVVRGEIERRKPRIILVHVGSRGNEDQDGLQVAVLRSRNERRLLLKRCCLVHVCSSGDEDPHDFRVPLISSEVEHDRVTGVDARVREGG